MNLGDQWCFKSRKLSVATVSRGKDEVRDNRLFIYVAIVDVEFLNQGSDAIGKNIASTCTSYTENVISCFALSVFTVILNRYD